MEAALAAVEQADKQANAKLAQCLKFHGAVREACEGREARERKQTDAVMDVIIKTQWRLVGALAVLTGAVAAGAYAKDAFL